MQGCAIWGAVDDERLTDTMASDKAVTTILKKNLYAESMSVGWNLDVFTYYGHVFLVGECPKDQRAKAIALAKKDNRVRSVSAHWFSEKKSNDSDFMTATRLRSNLIGTRGLSSTRVDTVVNAGRFVLQREGKEAGHPHGSDDHQRQIRYQLPVLPAEGR